MADATDTRSNILRAATQKAALGYNDRFPARGKAGSRGGDYRPLDDVSREGVRVPYRKYPSAAR